MNSDVFDIKRLMLTIHPVQSPRDKQEFVRLARTLYPPESPWVQPLDSVVLGYLDSQHNPFYRDGDGRAFIVKRGSQPVGRIMAHVWRRHLRLHAERVGYFGLFECADDHEAALRLFDAAMDFAHSHGSEVLRGPFNMTAAQEMGVVTTGFDERPALDMVYTPTWYHSLLEKAGLHACFRMQTWQNDDITALDPDTLPGAQGRRFLTLGGRIRRMRFWDRRTELEHVRQLINGAFLGNWNFVPITREEWEHQTGPLVPFLDPEVILFAELHGVPIGVTFAVPDFNHVLRRLQGKLLHPAAVSLLHGASMKAAVIILFAVLKQYQGLGICRLLNAELVRALGRRGYRRLATTWIGIHNLASRAQVHALNMHPLHDLTMYERRL